MHLQCFGLGAYLESNIKMRSLNNRWTCPVCGLVLKPRELRIDGYVEHVLGQTPESVEEVIMNPDGSYHCIEEEVAGNEKEPMPDADLVVAGATTHTSAVSTIIPNCISDLKIADVDDENHKEKAPMLDADPVLTCAKKHAVVVNDATPQKRKEIASLSPESKRPRRRTRSFNRFMSIASGECESDWDV